MVVIKAAAGNIACVVVLKDLHESLSGILVLLLLPIKICPLPLITFA